MKHRIVLAAAAGLLVALVPVIPAGADTTINANTFATSPAFCGSGSFTLAGTLEVKGGSGTLPTSCVVTMADNARLNLTSVTLSAPSGGFIAGAGNNTRIDVTNSTVAGSSLVLFSPGSDGPGRVRVDGSHLSGAFLGVSASCTGSNGLVEVTNSTLQSTSRVFIAASDNFDSGVCRGVGGGRVEVDGSTINAGGHTVSITSTSRTEVRGNSFNPADTRVVRSNGECRSENNTPTTPCA